MNYRPKISSEVAASLKAADRGRGWNSRSGQILRFEIGFEPGRCVLYVVPFRRFAYHQQEKLRAAGLALDPGEEQA